jgi:hypothetical protein
MSLTTAQIKEAFDAMGLNGPPGSQNAAPSAAVISTIAAVPDTYQALNDIMSLPEVQSDVIPILAMFDLALGHDPTSATLSSMVESTLSQQELANEFVDDPSFAAKYYNGENFNHNTIIDQSNSGIITALFLNGLGHAPSAQTLQGFIGLSLGEAFLEFTQSNAVAVSSTIDSSLLSILELATGVPAQAFPNPLQSFTLTNGSDSVIAGENTVQTTTPDKLVIQSTAAAPEDTTINAPLSGPFGNQATLTLGDVIDLSSSVGGDNILNATFAGSDALTSMTIKGVQTWNITQAGPGPSVILLEGTHGTIDGLTTLSYNGNGFLGSGLLVGAPGTTGIDLTTSANNFHLNVSSVPGGFVDVFFDPKAFTGGEAINVTANAVGNTLGGTSLSFGNRTDIEAGSAGATGGFVTWNVNSTGANAVNDIALSTNGSKTATTLNVSDDGSATIIWAGAGAAEWAQLTTIDAEGTTGQLTITGGESGNNGLLSDATGITSVTGGTGADIFDLTALSGPVAGVSISGGGNTTGTNSLGDIGTGIELSSSEINNIVGTSFASWSGVNILYDVADNTVGGTVDMAVFPGTNILTLLNPNSGTTNIQQGSNLDVKNGQNDLVINTNHLHQNGFNFEVDATAGLAAGDTVTVNYGDNGGGFPAGSVGSFTSLGYDNVNINISDISDTNFYTGGVAAVANGSGAEVLTIDTSVTLHIGSALTTDTVGTASLLLIGGTLIDPTSGTLNLNAGPGATAEIGVTNAHIINATGNMFMEAPDNAITLQGLTGHVPYTGDVVTSTGDDDVLQGTMGSLTAPGGVGGNSHTGIVGNDVLTDTTASVGLGNWFYGEGGQDTINLGGGGSTTFFGSFHVDFADHAQTITNSTDQAFQGFWGNGNSANPFTIGGGDSTSADMATINGFTMAGHNDTLNFNVDAWAGGSSLTGGLADGAGLGIVDGTANMQLVNAGDTVAGATNFALYLVGGLSDAADLAAALSGVGHINMTGPAGNFQNGTHMLFAYDVGGDIRIADVDFLNGLGAGNTTQGRAIVASDIADIVGGNNGTTTSLAILGINAHDVQFQHAA